MLNGKKIMRPSVLGYANLWELPNLFTENLRKLLIKPLYLIVKMLSGEINR